MKTKLIWFQYIVILNVMYDIITLLYKKEKIWGSFSFINSLSLSIVAKMRATNFLWLCELTVPASSSRFAFVTAIVNEMQ